jgi:catechol 2,3-dioxygenase-like lactoylglutathione lyase family enzyme
VTVIAMNLAHDLFAVRSEPRDSRPVQLQVRDLVRSIDFFATVLGLEVVRTGRLGTARCVAMSARGGRALLLHDSPGAAGAQAGDGLGFVVADLDQVRARAWDFGARVARHKNGGGEHQPGRSRSLWLYDPDGRELELVETDCHNRLGPAVYAACRSR